MLFRNLEVFEKIQHNLFRKVIMDKPTNEYSYMRTEGKTSHSLNIQG